MQREARVEEGDGTVFGGDLGWEGNGVCGFAEGNGRLIRGQAVVGGAVQGGEGFEFVECAFFFEHMGQTGHGVGGRKDASAAAGHQLVGIGVWRGIGAQEETRIAGGGGGAQRQTVLFAFGHG